MVLFTLWGRSLEASQVASGVGARAALVQQPGQHVGRTTAAGHAPGCSRVCPRAQGDPKLRVAIRFARWAMDGHGYQVVRKHGFACFSCMLCVCSGVIISSLLTT